MSVCVLVVLEMCMHYVPLCMHMRLHKTSWEFVVPLRTYGRWDVTHNPVG